jgi:hypothetical protein
MQVGNLFYGWWFKFYIRKNEVRFGHHPDNRKFRLLRRSFGRKMHPDFGRLSQRIKNLFWQLCG